MPKVSAAPGGRPFIIHMRKDHVKTDACDRVDAAIEGTKEQVLSWMKNAFPGLRKSDDQEVDTIWAFSRSGEAKTYETPDGNKVYLAESFFEVESARE